MARRSVTLLGIVLLVVVIAGIGGGWWYMATGRYAFAGDISHDFGEVTILDQTATVEHTFELRNRRSEPIMIEGAKPSCGCTALELPTEPVAPGETIQLPVSMSLSAAGHKGASIALILSDGSVQRLFVEAVGLRRERMTVSTRQLQIPADGQATFTVLYALQDPDAQPPEPRCSPPDGLSIEFKGWKLVTPADEMRRAAKWRGLFHVTKTGDEPLRNAPVPVSVGETSPTVIRVSSD